MSSIAGAGLSREVPRMGYASLSRAGSTAHTKRWCSSAQMRVSLRQRHFGPGAEERKGYRVERIRLSTIPPCYSIDGLR